jgi:hypothetical protein
LADHLLGVALSIAATGAGASFVANASMAARKRVSMAGDGVADWPGWLLRPEGMGRVGCRPMGWVVQSGKSFGEVGQRPRIEGLIVA